MLSSNVTFLMFLPNLRQVSMNLRGAFRTRPNIHPLTIFAKYSILDIPANIRLEDVFRLQKTSSRCLDQDEYVRLSLMSSRRLQELLVKTNIFILAIRLQDVLKTSSRYPQDVFKTSSRNLQDVLKTF